MHCSECIKKQKLNEQKSKESDVPKISSDFPLPPLDESNSKDVKQSSIDIAETSEPEPPHLPITDDLYESDEESALSTKLKNESNIEPTKQLTMDEQYRNAQYLLRCLDDTSEEDEGEKMESLVKDVKKRLEQTKEDVKDEIESQQDVEEEILKPKPATLIENAFSERESSAINKLSYRYNTLSSLIEFIFLGNGKL